MVLDAHHVAVVPLQVRIVEAVLTNEKCIDVANVPALLQAEECFKEIIGRDPLLCADQDPDERGRLLKKESYSDGKNSCLAGPERPGYEYGGTRRGAECDCFQCFKLIR